MRILLLLCAIATIQCEGGNKNIISQDPEDHKGVMVGFIENKDLGISHEEVWTFLTFKNTLWIEVKSDTSLFSRDYRCVLFNDKITLFNDIANRGELIPVGLDNFEGSLNLNGYSWNIRLKPMNRIENDVK